MRSRGALHLLWALVLVFLVQIFPRGEALQGLSKAVCARDLQADVQEIVHGVALIPALAALHLGTGGQVSIRMTSFFALAAPLCRVGRELFMAEAS